eukprot:757250-Hanusia_phi.AAC.3
MPCPKCRTPAAIPPSPLAPSQVTRCTRSATTEWLCAEQCHERSGEGRELTEREEGEEEEEEEGEDIETKLAKMKSTCLSLNLRSRSSSHPPPVRAHLTSTSSLTTGTSDGSAELHRQLLVVPPALVSGAGEVNTLLDQVRTMPSWEEDAKVDCLELQAAE